MSSSTEAAQGPLLSDQTSWEATRPLVHSAIVCIAIDTVIVLAKTYSRVQIAKLKFWWDDFWIIAAYILLMPICAIGLAMVSVEVAWSDEDRIIYDLDENEILLKYIYALMQVLFASYAATRYSILALYLRIFSDRRLRIALWVVITIVSLQWLVFGTISLFQCLPVQSYWDKHLTGNCVDYDKFYRSVTPFNMVIDTALVVLPLPTVWKLKATNTRKWALSLLFGVGISALVTSSIRLVVYNTHTADYIGPSLTNVMIMWLVIEPSVYLIAACLPAMHHILAAVVPQRVADWLSQRMGRLSSFSTDVLTRSKTRNMSLTSDDADYGWELTNSAFAARTGVRASPTQEDNTDWGELNRAIVVTKEVHVEYSQEERIERIIGF
ncbi:hypothetical protein M406DRAFT_71826 [Cryphonectria parasitica EP155]|uniref:Rhodopsin domain-containing protein n=1 Tax=Cryphonectria parasitica (strain ATCC 38755 / EP155) TaxID=660469 RepID=A0A9P5CSQ0_CRYP1|nr:uncharacterized protein M406DRAFT_71826 [Cryphonectria parasitica EP155]KAF3768857.1 hypothetical protein M406DRAFT_71826 [Cryphonectria parasitica EP155]